MKIPAMALVLVAASAAMAAETSLLFENSDFEKGDLTNWKAEGDAFARQPTKGDNPAARSRGPSRHQGEFWIGTHERHNGKIGRPGEIQGDGPKGKLTSKEFRVTRNYINFLVGGGGHMGTCVRLLCGGKSYYVSSGFSSETMRRVSADVRWFKGKTVRILVVDGKSGRWGHINADDFTASDKPLGALRALVISRKEDLAKEVTLGKWHRIGPFRDQGPLLNWMDNVASSFEHVFDVEKDARANGNVPLLGKRYPAPNFPATPRAARSWTAHPEWIDGYYQQLPRGPAPSAGESQYLYRTITVESGGRSTGRRW